MNMIRMALAPFVFALLIPLTAQAPRPMFSITLDGEGFANKEFAFPPVVATYTNNVWRSSSDARINRIDLSGFDSASNELQIGVPPAIGKFAFDKEDEDKPGRNPYLTFLLKIYDPKDSSALRAYKAEHVEVAITKLDAVGGRIEGTVRGTVRHDGGAIVTMNGRFSVVRNRDRIVD